MRMREPGELIKMIKIAKLVDMTTTRRIYNLTNFITAGVREITLGRAGNGSDQLIQLGELEDGTISEDSRVPCISRRHAMITYHPENGSYVLQNRSATHGTTVDDKRLEPMQEHILETGDSLKFAGYGPVVFICKDISRLERDTAQSLPRVG